MQKKNPILTFILLVSSTYILFREVIPRFFLGFLGLTFFRIPKDRRKDIERKGNVLILSNKEYDSAFNNNQFDIYRPYNYNPKQPTIIWIHGGGFMGGDKSRIDTYVTKIASYGFQVLQINYELIPKVTYPDPLKQISDFFVYLNKHAKQLNVDMDNIFIAGDSAGAHYTSQFCAIQSNENYAKILGIEPVLKPTQIKGQILFCGFYDWVEISHVHESRLYRYGFHQLGWLYYGERDWQKNELARTSSIANYLTTDYPNVFISDGNYRSFETDNKMFVKKLKEVGIKVDSLFFDINEIVNTHNYQLFTHTKSSKISIERVIYFINKNKKRFN